MTENTPPTLEEIRRLNRDLMERVLEKAESDPEWKQRLLDDPETTMMEAGFPQVQQAQVSEQGYEVTGQVAETVCVDRLTRACMVLSLAHSR